MSKDSKDIWRLFPLEIYTINFIGEKKTGTRGGADKTQYNSRNSGTRICTYSVPMHFMLSCSGRISFRI